MVCERKVGNIETIMSKMRFELCNPLMHRTGCMIQWCIHLHLFWCSCSRSPSWVERRIKNILLKWFRPFGLVRTARQGLGPHWYTPTLFWWSQCKHTVTTNMQCCQYRSITKQEPQSPGEIRQGQKGAEILSLLRDHNIHINHKNWSNLFVSICSLIRLRPMVSGPRAGAGIMRASHTLTLTCDHQTRIHGAQGPGQWTRPNFHSQHRFEFQIC